MNYRHIPYIELYNILQKGLYPPMDCIAYPGLGIKITRHRFRSAGACVLPGSKEYICKLHGEKFGAEIPGFESGHSAGHTGSTEHEAVLKIPDIDINGNREFDFPILSSVAGRNYNRAILFFHGLNEKRWDKYLPWAYRLNKITGSPVIMFPMAFHMNRAPAEWTDTRLMSRAAKERMAESESNSSVSFVNAAISSRLEEDPRRFFWSGLETFIDVKRLLRKLKKGEVNGFAAGTTADIFAYSIGAYFSLILFMASPGGLLDSSKLFLFTGCATLDRMYPINRYILDARASSRLGSFYMEHVNNGFAEEKRLRHYLGFEHPEEGYFKTMLLYHSYKTERETRLRQIAGRIRALTLRHDEVIPPVETLNTLNGEFRDIEIPVEILDFPYPYTHVTPFSLMRQHSDRTNEAFETVMNKAGKWFC